MEQTPFDQSINARGKNSGKAALFAGILMVIFGWSASLIPLAILIVAVIATMRAFKENPHQKKLAKIGIGLCLLMVILQGIFGIPGILGFVLGPGM